MPNELNITFIDILNLFGGIQGFFLAFLLLIFRKKSRSSNRYLAVILMVLGTIMLHQFLIDSNYIYMMPYLAGITMPLEVAVTPAFYLYIRTMIKPEIVVTRSNTAIHFLPVLLCALCAIPFFLLEFNQKLTLIQSAYAIDKWTDSINIAMPLIFSIGGIVLTVYLYLCLRMLFQHSKNIANIFSFREKVSLQWLRNLMVIFIVFWFAMMFFFSHLESSPQAVELMSYMSVLTVFSIHYLGVMGLLQPRIFKDNKQINANNEPEHADTGNAETDNGKYQKSALTKEMSEKISIRLGEVMSQHKPYMNSNLTLAMLAKQVATSPNYLSQVINEHLEQTFFDYVNSYRIQVAKQLLIDPLPSTPTILDIAMESAFNSKSAFYKAFKTHTGLTPTQYKSQNT